MTENNKNALTRLAIIFVAALVVFSLIAATAVLFYKGGAWSSLLMVAPICASGYGVYSFIKKFKEKL